MFLVKQTLTALALFIVLATWQTEDAWGAVPSDNFISHDENLMTGGQPSKSQLQQLKDTGVTKVINLRSPTEEVDFDEMAEVERLGLEYVSLPIAGTADVTSENARKLDELLQGSDKVLAHCSTGNRVGALLAIRAHDIMGKSVEDSIDLGREAGLASLEARVKAVLSESESEPANLSGGVSVIPKGGVSSP